MANTTHNADDLNTEGKYIPKSYQFERDMDSNEASSRHDTLEFDERSNDHFVYDNATDLLDTTEGQSDLADMIRVFLYSQKDRIEILEDYSKGKNTTILTGQRRLDKNKADYRISHNYGGYISDFITGFILGNPVTVGSTIEDTDDLKDVEEIHFGNDIDVLNYDLGYDVSRYGRGFELHLRNEDNQDKIYLIEPKEMFVIRSADVTKEIIAAVHCPIYNGRIELTVYTDDEVITFQPFKPEDINLTEDSRKKHLYGIVPVVEWWNNRYRTGDFEPVIPIIDAYDASQSDTSNYMSDLNDAMLVVNVDDIEQLGGNDGAKEMADANMLIIENGVSPDGKVTKGDAGYIYKQYDVAGTESYKDRLLNDIFKLSNVPNLDNEKFGTASGIAIQYKLVGLRQIQAIKENYFVKAMRRRYQLIENIHKELHDVDIQADALTFTFHPNLPQDIWSEVMAFIDAGGELSQETLRELASFTDEAKEVQRLAEEGVNPAMTDAERSFWLGGATDDTESATGEEQEL